MISKKEAEALKKDMLKKEDERETAIRTSRDIIKISKQIIYALHREDMKSAVSHVPVIKKLMKMLNMSADTNMTSVAAQEYAEAMLYFEFEKGNSLPSAKDLGVSTHDYLGGLSDFSGELVRRGINLIIKGKSERSFEIKKLVEDIYGFFLELDIRNNDLRKKNDAIKYNLRRLEDALFQLQMR